VQTVKTQRRRIERRSAFTTLGAVAVLSIVALLLAERRGDVSRSETRQSVPVEPLTPAATGTPETERSAGDRSAPAAASWHLSEFYHGPAQISGTVQTKDGFPVAGAEVVCVPCCFDPMRPEEFSEITTHTNPSGFFSLPNQPDTIRYTVCAFTKSHYGTLEAAAATATDGHMVVTVVPVYYTWHEFVDAQGQPLTELPREAQRLIWGCVLASTHASGQPSPFDIWILKRMGIQMPEQPNIAATVFFPPVGPSRPSKVDLAFPGYFPVSIGLEPHLLSDWPKGETVHLVPDSRESRICYEVEIPAPPAWPAEWGPRDPRWDFHIWYTVDGRRYASVNRRTPAFGLEAGASFTLKDQSFRKLAYSLIDRGGRKIVRPDYPAYAYLRVTFTPTPDLSKPCGVTLVPKGETDHPKIIGISPFPGISYFGPLAVGEYEAQLQWFVGGMAAFVPIRDLGIVVVREGANDYRRE
jgi:hypothetical protein